MQVTKGTILLFNIESVKVGWNTSFISKGLKAFFKDINNRKGWKKTKWSNKAKGKDNKTKG